MLRNASGQLYDLVYKLNLGYGLRLSFRLRLRNGLGLRLSFILRLGNGYELGLRIYFG